MVSEFVVDITEATFQSEVIEFSENNPVIIDFWADWCGPCKTLTPLLEEMADEYRGAFRVAKIDTDKEQRLAMAFRVQSLPTVIALFQGRPINTFSGALPKSELRRFIDQLLSQTGTAIPESDSAPSDPIRAEKWWRSKLAENDKDPAALLGLGQLLLTLGKTDEAENLLAAITSDATQYSDAQASIATMALINEVATQGGEQAARQKLQDSPDDPDAQYLVACCDAAQGQFVNALTVFVALVGKTSGVLKDKSKQAAAIVLNAGGRDNPDLEILRRKLSRLIF